MFVIGIGSLCPLRGNGLDKVSHHIVSVLGDQAVGILNLRHVPQGVISVFRLISLRRGEAQQTGQLVILVKFRVSAPVGDGGEPVSIIVGVGGFSPFRVQGGQEVSHCVIGIPGDCSQRIGFAGDPVDGVISVDIDRLSRFRGLYKISCRIVFVGISGAVRLYYSGQTVQGIVLVAGNGLSEVGLFYQTSEGIVLIEGGPSDGVALPDEIPAFVVTIEGGIPDIVLLLRDAAHLIISVGGYDAGLVRARNDPVVRIVFHSDGVAVRHLNPYQISVLVIGGLVLVIQGVSQRNRLV